jgi:hypothetical protein
LNQFSTYFDLGFFHIFNLNARDHLLFLLVLLIVYTSRDSGKIIAVITSFTLAHTLSLILVTFDFISIPDIYVEVAIAATILVTALENIFWSTLIRHRIKLSIFFGLIHGLGFSAYLKSLLGVEISIVWPLFGFNVGVEVGQLAIVVIMAILVWILTRFISVKQKTLVLVCSLIVSVQASIWILLRLQIISVQNLPSFLKFISL